MTLRSLAVWHLIGLAVLLTLGYYWLGVGESDASHLALSVALLLAAALGMAYLYGTAFAYFRTGGHLRMNHLPPLLLLVLAAGAIYFAAEYWNPVSENRINQTASYLTLTFQTPVRPAQVERVLGDLWWVVEWVLIPLLLLPMAAGVAVRGWAGFGGFTAVLKRWSVWLAVPLLLLASVWVPLRLMAWTPAMSSFAMETASLVARFVAAYLLFVAGGLAVAFVTSRGRPEVSHPTTVVSP
jgi:hypothetical protein